MRRRSNTHSTLNVDVIVPDHISVTVEENEAAFILLQVHRSRLLWREVKPYLFQANTKIARRLVRSIVDSVDLARIKEGEGKGKCELDPQREELFQETKEDSSLLKMIQRRQLRIKTDTKGLRRLVVWIQPPTITPLEYYFMSLMIKWEHERIQAESLAGYIATLGGGFFMCHHWSTAVRLAQQQQRLAAYLGDTEMYYKCLINQAYNYIHAGRFRTANRLVKLVLQAVQQGPHEDEVLVKMCYSARLFGKRVRKAAVKNDQESHSTVDDFARIRLVQDQSKDADLIKPFRS